MAVPKLKYPIFLLPRRSSCLTLAPSNPIEKLIKDADPRPPRGRAICLKGPHMRLQLAGLVLLGGLMAQAQAMAPMSSTASQQVPDWAVALPGQPACVRDRLVITLREETLPSRLAADRAQLEDVPALASFAQARQLRASRPLIQHELDGVAHDSGLDRVIIVDLAAGRDLASEQALWAARPEVEAAELDWMVHTMLTPNDPNFSTQWALNNTGTGGYTADCDIDAPEAWNTYTGSTTVKIAIIDTGVRLTHQDLSAKVIAGYDFVNGDTDPTDDNMHGTACASLAAASTNNSLGMAGVDWNARVMPLKVLNASGSGTTTNIVSAVDWARTNGANVISMSLGGGSYLASFNTAINNAYNAGIPVICAAGNDNSSTISYPAAYTNSFAVGAMSPCNQRKSPSSCDGETWWGSNYGTGLDLISPGVLLRSATNTSNTAYITNMNGTSGATPIVAGVAALVRGRNSALTAQQIYDLLNANADDLSTAGWDSQTGWGRLNAQRAVAAAAPDPCASETIAPVLTHTALGNTSNTTTPYAVSATVTDNCTLASVTLRWQINGGVWNSAAMTAAGSTYSGSIPAQVFGSTVHYQIVAVDARANTTTGDYTFNVLDPCLSDATAPAIVLASGISDTYNLDGPYVGSVTISDPCGLIFQALTYTVNGGPSQGGIMTNIGGNTYSCSIPGQPANSTVVWTVSAGDNSPAHNSGSLSWTFHVLNPCDIETVPPVIVHTALGNTSSSAPYTVEATVTDNCAVAGSTLRWQINGGTWSSVPMTAAGSVFSGAIPAQAYGSLVAYEIVALDARGNTALVAHTFVVVDPCASDAVAPALAITTTFANPVDPAVANVAAFSSNDPCGLSIVAVTYSVDGGSMMVGSVTPAGVDYLAEIPGQTAGSVVAWTLFAVDDSPAHNQASLTGSYTVVAALPVDAPVVTLVWTGENQLTLGWGAVVNATAYKIYSSAGATGPWTLLQTATGTSAVLDVTGLNAGFFKVSASN